MKIINTIGDDQYSVLELVDEIPETIDANVLGILHEGWKGMTYYLPDNTMIGLKPISGHVLKKRALWVILSNTVYNPKRVVKVTKVDLGNYEISRLKESILKWVEKDDDILLQYIDEKDIRMLLSRAETYDDLIFAIRAINGEFETDKEFEKQLISLGISWLAEEEDG